jgi:preprotein translocase subunit SecY
LEIYKKLKNMGNVSFGARQLRNPTPSKLSNVIQIFTVVGSLVLAWIGTASFIPAYESGVMQSVLGLLIGIANGLKPFFGVETDKKKVDIEDVGEMESNKD